jgi:histidyl-tRNA synthetase
MLSAVGVAHEIDPLLVRGLDYYTRTVWEFSSSALGAQSAVGAGGRYDGLIERLGGPATPAVGFGTGIERIVLCLEAMQAARGDDVSGSGRSIDAYIGVHPDAGSEAWSCAFEVVHALRQHGRVVELDLGGRSAKGQSKQASRLDAQIRVLIEDAAATMFLRGDYEGANLQPDAPSIIRHLDAQFAAHSA